MRAFSIRTRILGGTVLFLLFSAIIFVGVINHKITTWIDGPRFQTMLDMETSKGLKLSGSFSPLTRVGIFGLKTDQFLGINGSRTIVTLEAHDITGAFNPLGVVLRHWEIDSGHIKSGTVMLQKTEPIPGAPKGVPWPPWWALFWPYRVQLADIKVDDAKILWKLQNKESGIYDTRLEVTPNGRDFEYDAHDGDFRTPFTPSLKVVHIHLLVRKPRLYCSEFFLGDKAVDPSQQVRVQGDAGLQDDRSMHLKMDLTALEISPWLPEKLRAHVVGQVSGHFDYASTGTGLETGQGAGQMAIANGLLRELPQIRQYVVLTGSPDPGPMVLKTCRADVGWQAGAISAENIEIECEGVFRMTGKVTIAADKTLDGRIELGLTAPYLHWLPTARTAVFTRTEGPYHFTTIHFSGTSQNPKQDLSSRIAHEIEKSPLLAAKLFFNQAGEWFDQH